MGDCDDPQITRAVVDSFLAAVQSRSSDAVAACFTDAARYANVPHPPAIGPAAILTVFQPILRRSQRARWDIVSSAYDGATAWLQRVDRFLDRRAGVRRGVQRGLHRIGDALWG